MTSAEESNWPQVMTSIQKEAASYTVGVSDSTGTAWTLITLWTGTSKFVVRKETSLKL